MFKVTNYSNITQDLDVLKASAELLNIKDAELILINNDQLLSGFGGDDYIVHALLHKTKMPNNVYNLYIKSDPGIPIKNIFCHEMLHLKQCIDGDLIVDLDKKQFVWKGNVYPKTYPYRLRPWEQEVFRKENKFLSDVRKKLGKPRKCIFSFLKK